MRELLKVTWTDTERFLVETTRWSLVDDSKMRLMQHFNQY